MRHMKKLGIIILVMTICSFTAFAQKKGKTGKENYKYNIEFTIKGVSDTVIYVGHHLGEKKYVIDTIQLDANGHGIMKGDKEIHKGIYLVVLPSRNMNFFEFLMGPEGQRNFSIETDTTNFVKSMKIRGSPENVAFNNYQRHMMELQQERFEIEKAIKQAGDDKDAKEAEYEKMKNLNERRIEYMKKVENENKGTLFGSIMRSMHDVEIPDFPRDENGVITDSTFQYKYYKKHYFDYIDFEEEGLVRTPIYESKLNYYFEKMVVPSPDSLIVDAHNVIQMTYDKGLMKGDSLIYKYTLSHLLNYFEESKIMGYDAVFVAIAEDWYLSGKAPWADTSFMSKLKERVEKITPTRLGSVAYNLTRMQSVDDRYYNLHDIKSDFTVLIFWEPSCGHCKKEVPKLIKEFRDTLKDLGVKVFAIYTQYDKKEWEEFINDKDIKDDHWINVWDGPYPHSKFRDYYDIYSTPVIYVLDKNKKIVGKRLNVENIKDLILFEKRKEEYEKNNH